MFKVVLIAINNQESSILKALFEQQGFQVFISAPSAGNYLQFMQYRPDVILVEMTGHPVDQLAAIRLVKKNRTLATTPILCYGSSYDAATLNMWKVSGMGQYLLRPLKVASLLESISKLCPSMEAEGKQILSEREQKKAEELARLLDPNAPPFEKTSIMVRHIGKLMAFPFTVSKVLQVSGDDGSGASDLAKVIASDSAVCTTILKVANSVHFAGQKEIRSPKDAIIRIGFQEVKNIAMGLGVLNLFAKEERGFGFSRQAYWQHCLGRALLAEKMASQMGCRDLSMAFLAGLLSEFGVLLLDEFFPDIFNRIVAKISTDHVSTEAASLEILGFDLRNISTQLLEEWRMPKELVFSLRAEATALNADAKPSDNRRLDLALALSSPFAKMADLGRSLESFVRPISEECIQEARVSSSVRLGYFETVFSGLRLYAQFLHLDLEQVPSLEPSADRPRAVWVKMGKRWFSPHMTYLERSLEISHASKETLDEMLVSSDFPRIVVIDVGDAPGMEEAQEYIKKIADRRNRGGGEIFVLGFAPQDIAFPEAAEGLPIQWNRSELELRVLDQQLEALVGAVGVEARAVG